MLKRFVQIVRAHPIRFQIVAITAIVIVLTAAGVLYPSTKFGYFLIILLAVLNPRLRGFVLDFAPFIVLLVTYSQLRSYADNLSVTDIHITDLIKWERAICGGVIPSHVLQTKLSGQFYSGALNVVTNAFYLSHFITPVIAAAALWWNRRTAYWSYMIGLVVLSYAGFLTYILFPAAPPWWATEYGYLPTEPVTLNLFVISADTVRSAANPVAAVPSLHAAYPTFIALVSVAVWGRRALPVFLLPVGVAFSTFYLGHHYVVDALAGALYALVCFGTVFMWLYRREFSLESLFAKRTDSARTGDHQTAHSVRRTLH
ncbi:MAG: phosphatase PAP2 family protein [Anaerolineae bacterium]|nr:phosphatase PAP2 family protein [Anaerolineae bacterium]